MKDLPARARRYIDWIESYLATPISLVSVGPEPEATIVRGSTSRWLY